MTEKMVRNISIKCVPLLHVIRLLSVLMDAYTCTVLDARSIFVLCADQLIGKIVGTLAEVFEGLLLQIQFVFKNN